MPETRGLKPDTVYMVPYNPTENFNIANYKRADDCYV